MGHIIGLSNSLTPTHPHPKLTAAWASLADSLNPGDI